MQQALRSGMPPNLSPVPTIQHPPPNTNMISAQGQRQYLNPSAAYMYEQQQRIIQQNQHRDRQLAAQRSLGVQPGAPQLIQHPQLPTRTPSHPPPPGVRPIQGQQMQVQQAPPGWAHAGAQRVPDQQMQYHQHQLQMQQQHPQYPQSLYQPHAIPVQQVMQIQAGYRMASTPTSAPPQQLHPGAIQRQPAYTTTPTKAPPASDQYYPEGLASLPSGPASAPIPNGSQELRAPSRQSMRSLSPMGPPPPPAPLQIQTSVMQVSSSLSAVETQHPPVSLPARSSTLPLPSAGIDPFDRPDEANETIAGPSSSKPAKLKTPSPRPIDEEDEHANPQRLVLRKTLSLRLKRHLDRTEKQLAVAEKVEKALKGKKAKGRSCKEMSRDEHWRGKFDDLIQEYLDRAGYVAAAESLRSGRSGGSAQSSGMDGKPDSHDTALSESATSAATLVESGEPGTKGLPERQEEDEEEAMNDKEGEVKGASATPADGNLGKLFMWYSVQRLARQITTTLQSSAVREFRLAADVSTTPTEPLNAPHVIPDGPRSDEAMVIDEAAALPTSPAAQPSSAATAAKIVISAPQAAIRAGSTSLDHTDPIADPDPTADQQQADDKTTHQQAQPLLVSPNEMVNLTATLQEADAMRAAQEQQIRAQQEAQRAAPETARAENGMAAVQVMHMHGAPVPIQSGANIGYMPQMYGHQGQPHQTNWMVSMSNGAMPYPAPVQAMHPQQQMMSDIPRGPTPIQKRQMETEQQAVSKKQKLVGKKPTPEEHQRMAVEMGALARAQPPFSLHHGGNPEFPGGPASHSVRPMTETERQYAYHQAAHANAHARQLAATSSGGLNWNTPLPPLEDMMTPQATEAGPSRTSIQAGAPSPGGPGASRASHKKRPSALGLDSLGVVVEGEATPTSGRKKGGKRPAKGPVKSRKGKQETPKSIDGPVTPFGQPQTPISNISHTPSYPPGEFQPDPLLFGGALPGHQRSHNGGGPPQQLQVSLQHQPPSHHFSLPPAVPPNPHRPHGTGHAPALNGDDESYDLPLDDELMKAFEGYANGGIPDDMSGEDTHGTGGAQPPPSAPFDSMGFEQDNGFDLHDFDWTNMLGEGAD